jgi:hypothetical protein
MHPGISSDEICNMVGIPTLQFTPNLEEQSFYVTVICCYEQYMKGFEVGPHFDSTLLCDLVGSFVSLKKSSRDVLQDTKVSTKLARISGER